MEGTLLVEPARGCGLRAHGHPLSLEPALKLVLVDADATAGAARLNRRKVAARDQSTNRLLGIVHLGAPT